MGIKKDVERRVWDSEGEMEERDEDEREEENEKQGVTVEQLMN